MPIKYLFKGLKNNYKHFFVLSLYVFASVAFLSIFVNMLKLPEYYSKSTNEISSFAINFYHLIEKKKYGELKDLIIEGKWNKTGIKQYNFERFLTPDEIRVNFEDDFGEIGIRFTELVVKECLLVLNIEDLGTELNREKELITIYKEKMTIPSIKIFMVSISGHVIGRCSIVDWVRKIPVIKSGDKIIIIARGTPQDYYMIHREQMFLPVKF